MTPEMLHFLFGEPVSVDEKATKAKVIHTYKYQATGIGRYALRIQLENDEVIGWDIKGGFIPNPSYGFEFRQCSDGLWRFVPPGAEDI